MKPHPPQPGVLHLLAPARVGGLEQVVHMLATHQREENAHVAAVMPPSDQDAHPFCVELARAGVAVLPIHVAGRDYLGEYRALSNVLRTVRPRVVHTHGYRADVVGGLAARRHGIATVSTVHGFTGGGRRNRFYEGIQCRALRHADAVIGVSRSIVARLASTGVQSGRIHCIPNGYGSFGRTGLASRAEARRELGLPTEGWMVGWIGRVSREKALDVALEALAQAEASWQLVVIGEGPERPQMMRLAESLGVGTRVHWKGIVGDAARLIPAFDAVVLSSRTEGTPIVLLEAMHAGIPIIAAAVGGVPDMLGEQEALLVAPESPRAIARALEELRAHADGAARRARAARERLERQFAMPAWIDAVRSVYASVAPMR